MDIEKELQDIFNDPLFADVKPTELKPTSDDRLVQSFEEINHSMSSTTDCRAKQKG